MTPTQPPSSRLPRIAITMGDPAGIGPELCCRLLGMPPDQLGCVPVVFGDRWVVLQVAEQLNLDTPFAIANKASFPETSTQEPTLVDASALSEAGFCPGKVSAATGQASFEYIEAAIEASIAGTVQGVTTGPIHKQAWGQAGIPFPGHTELFAERYDTTKFCMMMTAPAFSCSLVTTHIGYRDVPEELSTERILEVIRLTEDALARILGRQPCLAVLGLNPHAGESGLFGNHEEEHIIQPAIEAARLSGMKLDPVYPPDTAFLKRHRDRIDGYICMYHDQGLIPFKALNFETGVNITLGLPTVRTSVDHGTALDIAWQGQADVSSLIAAVSLAAKLA